MEPGPPAEIPEMWKTCFAEEITCPACLSIFVDPVQLPCQHTFCLKCIHLASGQSKKYVGCLVCNYMYPKYPIVFKDIVLGNILDNIKALVVKKEPQALQCRLCIGESPCPAEKVCLSCRTPCCLDHFENHVKNPAPDSQHTGHLLVPANDLQAWTCQQHHIYKLYYCETEQAAACKLCLPECKGHTVSHMEEHLNDVQEMLCSEITSITEHAQVIEKQLEKLELERQQKEERKEHVKKQVQLQYDKMQELLQEDMQKMLDLLDKRRESLQLRSDQHTLQLKEQHSEATQLHNAVQDMLTRAENINFIKNTTPMKVLINRSSDFMNRELPRFNGHLEYQDYLCMVAKKEKLLEKILEEPVAAPRHTGFIQRLKSSMKTWRRKLLCRHTDVTDSIHDMPNKTEK